MTERPIIFSAPMVRAILGGRKTQTRRVVKTGAYPHEKIAWWEPAAESGNAGWWSAKDGLGGIFLIPCPYGRPGDRLWVRETWGQADGRWEEWGFSRGGPDPSLPVLYRADGDLEADDAYWRPSIHMPQWASRLTLEVTAVRVERLQEISAKDVLAEGAVARPHVDQFGKNPVSAFDGKVYLGLQSLWRSGWDSVNTKRGHGWETNPWVWVVEFKKVDKGNHRP